MCTVLNFDVALDIVDKNRIVLNPCKDYRSSAKGYVNASLIKVHFLLVYLPVFSSEAFMVIDGLCYVDVGF